MEKKYHTTDGRKKDGVYQDKMIDWFVQQEIDTTTVLVETIRVHHQRSGYYVVQWDEAVKTGNPAYPYLTKPNGEFRTQGRRRVVRNRPYWLEED